LPGSQSGLFPDLADDILRPVEETGCSVAYSYYYPPCGKEPELVIECGKPIDLCSAQSDKISGFYNDIFRQIAIFILDLLKKRNKILSSPGSIFIVTK
jgi:hypothetical protein